MSKSYTGIVIIGVVALIGLILLNQLNPVRDFPNVDITTTLAPDETIIVTVPEGARSLDEYLGFVFPMAKLYFNVNSDGLELINSITPLIISMAMETMYVVEDTGHEYRIRNTYNYSREINVIATRAPAPDDISATNKWFMFGISAFNVLVTIIYAVFVKRPVINIRKTETQVSCIGQYLCCCIPACRKPKSSRQISEEMAAKKMADEERRLKRASTSIVSLQAQERKKAEQTQKAAKEKELLTKRWENDELTFFDKLMHRKEIQVLDKSGAV